MTIEKIINRAKELNICDEWAGKMEREKCIKTLCEMFFKGSDWATENNFPTAEMVESFPEAENYGLRANCKYKGFAESRMAFFGESKAEVLAKNFEVSVIYVRHKTKLKAIAKDNAIVFIYAYDDSEVEIIEKGNGKVRLKRYE
ncbi:hypothetical protein [Bergeyella zoohelcum]|uniref:hypothetical protein n=1 Tax=Bergeyella zoohelcum TaxID=1015 RepID=UPI00373579B4